jgi:hypothetical protein
MSPKKNKSKFDIEIFNLDGSIRVSVTNASDLKIDGNAIEFENSDGNKLLFGGFPYAATETEKDSEE